MSLTSRIKPWQVDVAGVGAIFGVGAICYFLLAQPLLQHRAAARAQAVELDAKRASLARTRAARLDAETRLVEVRKAISEQSVRLEPRNQVNKRLDDLTRLAAECDIGVERLSPGPTADGPRHGTMTLHLVGKADYRACELFVSRLHSSFNDTAVTMLRMASVPESKEPVTVELELLWFTAPDVKVAPR